MTAQNTAHTPAGPAQRRRRTERRQQVQASAALLFARSGFEHVTMSQIAESVGITASALYRLFDSKSAILAQILTDWADRATPPLDSDPSLEEILEHQARVTTDIPGYGVLWSRESRHAPAEVYESLVQKSQATRALLAAKLGDTRPELSEDGRSFLVRAAQSALSSLTPGLSNVDSRVTAHLLTAMACAMVNAPLGPEPEESRAPGLGLLPATQREALLTVAARLFAERGYRGTNMGDIGAATKVSGPSLYAHFSGKAEVFEEVVRRANHAQWMILTDALHLGTDHDDVVDRLVLAFVDLVWTRRYIIGLLGYNLHLQPDIERSQRDFVREWMHLLAAIRPELAANESRMLVYGAMNVVSDLVLAHQAGTRAITRRRLVDLATAVLHARI